MRSIFFVLCFALYTAEARADMVPDMPPLNCSPGAIEEIDHGGPYCAPTSCKKDSDCRDGALCQTQGLCIGTEKKTGRTKQVYTYEVAVSTCSNQEACNAGKCKVAKRCVMPAKPVETPPATSAIVAPPKSEPVKTPETLATNTPTTRTTNSPPKVDPTINQIPPTGKGPKGCSVSPVESVDLGVMSVLVAFALILGRKRRDVS